MAKYSAVKATVNAYIKQNGRKEITGRILNAVLNATIDSLGKYFQFAGGALPTDDPGTPDQNVCYLAGEPGVYTNFGGITIENEEVALLFWDGEWTKQRILIGIREVNASVDNQVGTPSVDVSYSGGELVLTFHNLKGDQGETGDPAGFGTIGADINGGVGTPGVSVETSGDNTAKNLMFHFTNLKGETGVTSVVATIDDTSGAPSCQVSLVGQQLTLAFSGLKGLKGDTGVSADYPITIYNGLDSDATDQALAAAQGNVLDGKIGQLEAKLTGLIDISDLEAKTMYPNGATWLVNTNYKCKFYPCVPGVTYNITANNSYYGHATFVKEIGTTSGQSVNYATGYSDMVAIVTGGTKTFLAPNDAVYLVIEVLNVGTDRTPASIKQPAIDSTITEISNRVISLSDSVDSLLIEQKPGSERGRYIRPNGTYVTFSVMRISECLNIPTIDCTIKHLWQDGPNVGYGIVFLDENYNFVGNLDVGNGIDVTYSWVVNNVSVPSGAKYIVLQSQNKEAILYSSEILLTTINAQAMIRSREGLIYQNILFGKKWVACGDSWTAGDFTGYVDSQGHTGTESDAYDPAMGMYKTYPWWIAKRNGIVLVNEAVAGTTMTTRVANSFSDVRYANVPLDADYITLMFGLNETTQSPGTSGSTDKSTLWGAWNFSLEYLMTNIPRAKIGVIIPDGWMAGDSSQTCRETMIDVAKAWGIPYLDLTGDPHISLGVGGRISSLDLKTSAKVLRDSQYKLDNNHPNLLAHEMRSTYIEAFLRSL